MDDTVAALLDLLDGVKQAGDDKYMAKCPAHDDNHASLSIRRGEDGRALLNCKAGCKTPEVVKAIGWTMKDLFPGRDGGNDTAQKPRAGKSAKSRPPKVYPTVEDAVAAACPADGTLVKVWAYPGDSFRVARFNLPGTDEAGRQDKTFRPVCRKGAGWSIGDPPGRLPLYRGDRLPDAERVIVTEGERAADAAGEVGLAAVTSAHGAKSAAKSDWQPLAGREIIIMPDNDDAGRIYAQDVATILTALSPPATVRVLELPGLPEHGDIADYLEDHDGQDTETLRAGILALAEAMPSWTPPIVSAPALEAPEPYRPFPVEVLPEPFRRFVTEAATAIGCDPAFVALPLLAAAASAIGNTRCLELKRGWTEPAIIWTAIVGDSGTLKSPAIELALRFLRRRQHEATKQHARQMEAHKTELLRYEIDLAGWKKSGGEGTPPVEPQAPILPRCWCDDTTIEALAVLLLQNWRGLLMVRDELAGWLGSFDRYSQGKGGDVAKWLEMHGGRSMMVDRKTGDRKTIYVPRAAVSVTGGIQPATLQRALGQEYFDNGLVARLLLACPPRQSKHWTETENNPATENAVAAVFDRLCSLEPILGQDGEPEPGIVRLSQEGKALWINFYNAHATEQAELIGDLSAAWSKLEGYAARLALVVHLVCWAAGDWTSPEVVDTDSVAAGVTLSRWFGQETRRVYGILDETDEDRQRRGLVELIECRGGRITARELMHGSRNYRQGVEVAEAALDDLQRAGLGRWEDSGTGKKGGRPTRLFVLAATGNGNTTLQSQRK